MRKYLIQPQSGVRVDVNKGQKIWIIGVDGGQVADFFAEMKGTHNEYVSPSVTIDCNESLKINVGSIIYSNQYTPMFRVESDDVGVHDLLFPSCSKNMYDFFIKMVLIIQTVWIISIMHLERNERLPSPLTFLWIEYGNWFKW